MLLRIVLPVPLPRVEYEEAEFGRSLEPILKSMQDWGSAFKARKLAQESEEEIRMSTE